MENENQNADEKGKEYESMLKKLYKEQDVEKLKALASEYKEFDPASKKAAKWQERAEKLAAKMEKKQAGAGEKKGGFLSSLFKKKDETAEETVPEEVVAPEEAAAPQMPAAPAVPAGLTVAPMTPQTTYPAAPVVAPATQPAADDKAKGNMFTNIFGKKNEEGSKSIIDTIVAKTNEKKKEEKVVKKEEKVKVQREGGAVNLLKFSQVFMNFTAIFIVLSAGFLYVDFIDKGNTLLSLVGIPDNTGSRLVAAEEMQADLEREQAVLEKEIQLYSSGYEDKALDTVQNVIETRVNWPDIFAKIKEVTNSVYELNDFFQYIEYNNYSFDAERKTVRVTGTLSDPLGRNLTRLVELEEAFKYYPHDKNNPDDPTEPFFKDFREFTSFSKSLDPSTGRYTSSFQLSFALNE